MSAREALARGLWRAAEMVAPAGEPDDCERVMIERMEARGGSVDITLSHSVVKEIAGHMATWFDAASAGSPGNYVETTMRAPDGRMFSMTIRPLHRPTPHELRERAERRVAELEERLAAIEAHALTPNSVSTSPVARSAGEESE